MLKRRRRPPVPFAQRYLTTLIRIALPILRVRVVVEGGEHVPDEPGVIVASNHLSIMDPVLMAVVVEQLARRQIHYMAKAEGIDKPIVGALVRAYGGFGVRRGAADREAYRMARDILARGGWLGLAPEGTRSRTGHLGEPKPGVALLALRSGATILPVGIAGTERLWPIGARLPRPGTRVTIRFGEPYRPPSRTGDRRATIEDNTDDLMRRIAALLPAEYRGRFGDL